jgi:hypothetical protein
VRRTRDTIRQPGLRVANCLVETPDAVEMHIPEIDALQMRLSEVGTPEMHPPKLGVLEM